MLVGSKPYERIAATWNRYWFAKESPAGLALFRIAFGIAVLIAHLPRLPYVHELYTPLGFMWPRQPAYWFPKLIVPLTPLEAYIAIAVLAAAAVTLIIGYRTRLAAFLIFLLNTYLMLLEGFAADSLAQVISVYAFLLMFSPAGSFFSVQAKLTHGRSMPRPAPEEPRTLRHLMIWQLAAIYISNASMKIAYGLTQWRSGLTLLWLMKDTEWSQPWVWPLISHFETPFRIFGAIGFFLYLFLGVGLLFKKTRPYAATFGLAWHALAIGLTTISAAWLGWVSIYILLIEPGYVERLMFSLSDGTLPPKKIAFLIALIAFFVTIASYGRF